MSATPNLVNGQAGSLTTVNKAKSSKLSELIETILKTGADGNFGDWLKKEQKAAKKTGSAA